MHMRIGSSFDTDTSVDKLLSDVLLKRGYGESEAFLHPPHPSHISLSGLGFANEEKILYKTLSDIKENDEVIVVYTDYDTDGITGGAIMWETLHHLGFNVFPYVPHRQSEGYGFSKKGIDAAIKKYNPSLFISVDHGISARKEIDYIAGLGIKVIVTDHHAKPPDLPDRAQALFHCPLVSGSGLAYIVAAHIAHHFSMDNELKKKLFDIDLLALASFGIIADLVPLVGPARSIAYHGLHAISSSQKPGIRALLKAAGLPDKITAYHVGFALAPRINAVGRLSHAIEALRMLCTTNDLKAHELAMRASHYNTERQNLVERSVRDAFSQIDSTALPRIITVHSESWNEGVIGLIASKLVEKWRVPAIVLTRAENGWKGSARSIAGFDITSFLCSLNLLDHIGGHPQAAGFSLSDSMKDDFVNAVHSAADSLAPFPESEIYVDASIPFNLVTQHLARQLSLWEPFGVGNPRPVFQSKGTITRVQSIGKIKKHLKIFVKDTDAEIICFNPTDEQKKVLVSGAYLTFIYTIELNEWNGVQKTSCHLKLVV